MNAFSGEVRVYDMAVADVLRGVGIAFVDKAESNGTIWHNFVTCPMCQKTQRTGGKCGVSNQRGVRCFRRGDTEQLTYKPFLELIGALNRSWTGVSASPAAPITQAVPGRPTGPRAINEDWLGRLESNLRRTPSALEYLRRRGLTDDTIRQFRIGLDPATTSKGPARDFIKFPTWTAAGTMVGEYPCYAVPGLTTGIDVTDRPGWGAFSPITYYDSAPVGERRTAMVCEGMKDLWRVWQALQGTELAKDVVLMTSTHGTSVPQEWRTPEFWSRFDVVYLAFDRDDAGDTMAGNVAKYVRDADLTPRRLVPPAGILVGTNEKKAGKDWTDFFLAGRTVSDLAGLMETAPVISVVPTAVAATPGVSRDEVEGLQDWKPVDIGGAYVDGKLYYVLNVLSGETVHELVVKDSKGDKEKETALETRERFSLRRETRIICSDRTEGWVEKVWAKRGTPDADRVYVLRIAGERTKKDKKEKLPDIHVTGVPPINRYGRWRYSSVQKWMAGEFKVRPLAEILADIEDYFQGKFWLPNQDDFALLALTIPVTYAMRVFQAVPLIFINGEAGTGKSTIANAMVDLGFNGKTITSTSAATIARQVNESKGLVALDDIEKLGKSTRAMAADSQMAELQQVIQTSYKQDTAKKLWTDMKSGETKELDFFGVKIMTNTEGIGNILATRCFRIYTRKIPQGVRADLNLTVTRDEKRLAALRDELQAWAFDNVAKINEMYAKVCPKSTDREEEIAGPLRTIAALSGNEELQGRLEAAITRQNQIVHSPDDLGAVLTTAVKELVLDGYTYITAQHVGLQMATQLDVNHGIEFTTQIPEWQRADWIGRMLRMKQVIDDSQKIDRERFPFGVQVRVLPIAQWFLDEVVRENKGFVVDRDTPPEKALDFCKGCASCPYVKKGCTMQGPRLEWEEKGGHSRIRTTVRNN